MVFDGVKHKVRQRLNELTIEAKTETRERERMKQTHIQTMKNKQKMK